MVVQVQDSIQFSTNVKQMLYDNICRRNYDLYMNKTQFASISGNFLAWEFELKDQHGGTLALVDRNFQVGQETAGCFSCIYNRAR